jgi:hypothetical protein
MRWHGLDDLQIQPLGINQMAQLVELLGLVELGFQSHFGTTLVGRRHWRSMISATSMGDLAIDLKTHLTPHISPMVAETPPPKKIASKTYERSISPCGISPG